MPKPESNNQATVGAFLWAIWKHWITLMGGCALIVLVGILEKVSGKNIPLSAYLALVALLFCTACYLAWRDAQKRLADLSGTDAFKREFLADRLRTLLRDAEEAIKADNARTSIVFMEALTGFLPIRNRKQILLFLERYYDAETVQRFNEYGLPVVEELLADCFRDKELTVTQKVLDRQN